MRKMLDMYRELTREEELEALQNKDYETLACSQIAFIHKIASRFHRSSRVCMDDLVSAGLFALTRSLKKYDGSTRLTTYVRRTAEFAMLYEIKVDLRHGMRLPDGVVPTVESVESSKIEPRVASDHVSVDDEDELNTMRRNFQKYKALLTDQQREAIELRAEGMFFTEIGRRMGLSRTRAQTLVIESIEMMQMEATRSTERRERGESDSEDPGIVSSKKIVVKLSPREQMVIALHEAGWSYLRIAESIGVSHQRIYQIKARALEKLRG